MDSLCMSYILLSVTGNRMTSPSKYNKISPTVDVAGYCMMQGHLLCQGHIGSHMHACIRNCLLT